MLVIDSISRKFGGLWALRDVSMEIGRGMLFGLIGPNGAGKSTLFNVVTGLISPGSGKLIYEGKDISQLKPHQITALGISRTFQNIRLFNNMSVLENVMIGQHWYANSDLSSVLPMNQSRRKRDRTLRTEAEEIVKRMGLSDVSSVFPNELPQGYLRRIEIARALACRPKLLLLDEPAAGMNEEEVETLADDIIKIKEDGCSIFLIEHHAALVMEISDRIAVLNFGEKIAEGTPIQIQQNQKVREAYLGSEV